MAVFSTQIRDLTESEKPLYYNCQDTYYTNTNIKTSSIKNLEKSHNYTRVYFPNSSFKSFYDLNIVFDPFDDTVMCYFEVETQYTPQTMQIVRPFLVKLSSSDEDVFDITKDIIMLEGKAYFGKDYYELIKGIKGLAGFNQMENFISEAKQGLFSCSRYIPDITEFIETIDEVEIVEKLGDCYKILLSDIDENNVINFEKMIRLNLERICNKIIKPMVINILMAPNVIFNIFMTPLANIDEYKEKLIKTLQIKQNNLFMLECIESFSKFIKVYVDFEAFIDEKNYSSTHYKSLKEPDILPVHRLAYWEIVKYIHSIFKDKYITLKMENSKVISNKSNIVMDSDDDINDVNLSSFFDSFETSALSFKNPNIKQFVPESYSDFYDFETSQSQTIPLDDLPFDIDSLDDANRNIILQELETMISFDVYKQLLPKSRTESLFVTGNYAKI
jgi:hypothetical protein